jgi:large repetitive protein
MGAVQIYDQNSNLLASTLISGSGVGPLIAFQPGVQSTLATGLAPYGVAVDASGNVFSESNSEQVMEILAVNGSIPANPTISVLGSGFLNPTGVAVDGSGNVYVANADENEVKEILAVNGSIPANPTINVLACCFNSTDPSGTGFSEPTGVAVDASGNVYVANSNIPAVEEILAVNGSIPATNPTVNFLGGEYSNLFGSPTGVAVDASGNVYVADSANNAIYEILAVNGSIPPYDATINVLGSGFLYPSGVAVDASGNVYVADAGHNQVKEILAVNGSIPATSPTINVLGSGFSYPTGVAVDARGNIYVADHNGIEEINVANPPSLSFASTTVGSTSSDSPQSITFQNIGNATLTGSDSLSDTTDFTVVPGPGIVPDCTIGTVSLAPGAECNLSIDFTPQSTGPLSSTLSLSDNALNGNPATQTIQLSGTGTAATPSPQTISFTVIPAQNAGTSLNLSTYASASSGLPVSFTSMTTGICIVSGGTATFIAAGTCTIQASQLGNTSYAAAIPVSQSFLVHHVNQTVTFPAIGPQYAGTSVTLAATATSTLPVTFASNTTTICTVSGNTATLLLAGYCDIQASQAGNAEYFAAMTGQRFLVQHANQTIDFPTIATPVAATQLIPDATASSGLPVTFTSTTPAVCTVSGNTATLLAAGYCHILATQVGNGAYFAVSAGQNILVHHANQTITFSAIPGKEVGTIFNLTATTTSGLPITFTSTTPTICSVSGTTADLLNTGTCTIQASQAGNAAYFGAGPVTRSFTVR